MKDAATTTSWGWPPPIGKSKSSTRSGRHSLGQQQRAWLSYGFVLNRWEGKSRPGGAEKAIALDPATAQGIEATSMLNAERALRSGVSRLLASTFGQLRILRIFLSWF